MLPVIELEIKTKDMEKGVSDRGTINLFLFSLGLFFYACITILFYF